MREGFGMPAGWGRSLGLWTELALHQAHARIVDRGDHLVLRTPGQPGYYWGNFLAFREAPGPGDAERWPRLFAEAFGDDPAIRHMAFGWDDPAGDPGAADSFAAAGFRLEIGTVLTAEAVVPPARPNAELEVRPLARADEWEAAVRNQVACRAAHFGEAPYTAFRRARMAMHREVAEAGHGAWFGAFLDGRLVGDLGIYVFDGIGRFQTVGTDPDHRRRGVCGTLVHAAARRAFERMGARKLVIVAEPGEDAERIYRSLGFTPSERFAGTCRMADQDRARADA